MKLNYSKDKKAEIECNLNVWQVRKKDKNLNEFIKFGIIQIGKTKYALVIDYETHKISYNGKREIDEIIYIFNGYHHDIYFVSLEEAIKYSEELTQDYFK